MFCRATGTIKSELVLALTEMPFYPFLIVKHVGVNTRVGRRITSYFSPWYNPCEAPATLQRSTAVTLTKDMKFYQFIIHVVIDKTTYTMTCIMLQECIKNSRCSKRVTLLFLFYMPPYSPNNGIRTFNEFCSPETTNRTTTEKLKYNPHI